MFGVEKLEWCGYLAVKKIEDIYSTVDSNGQTDRRTDKHLATA